MNLSGPGFLCVSRFLINDSISLLIISLFPFSISSFFSLGSLHYSGNLSISSRLPNLLAYKSPNYFLIVVFLWCQSRCLLSNSNCIYFVLSLLFLLSLLLGLLFSLMSIYFWKRKRERERDRAWAGQGQRERGRETQNQKRPPGSEPSAQTPTQGSNSWTARSRPEPKLDA